MLETIDDTLEIPVLQRGDKLYHYTSAEGLRGICSGEFWITESHFLNDTTEFHVASEVFSEIIDRKLINKCVAEKIKKNVLDEVELLSSPGALGEKSAFLGDYVISFSLDYDSTLMWSEYSGFYGYCMEFDFEELVNSFGKMEPLVHGKVIYDRNKQIEFLTKAVECDFQNNVDYPYLNSWEDFGKISDEKLNHYCMNLAVEILAYNFFFKLPCFSGENEYRFIFSAIHDGGNVKKEEYIQQNFKIKNGVLIPYIKRPMRNLDSLCSVC